MKLLYGVLTLDSTNLSPESIELDRKIIKFLAAIGIPVATVLHGYVGFILGGDKGDPDVVNTPHAGHIFVLCMCFGHLRYRPGLCLDQEIQKRIH